MLTDVDRNETPYIVSAEFDSLEKDDVILLQKQLVEDSVIAFYHRREQNIWRS